MKKDYYDKVIETEKRLKAEVKSIFTIAINSQLPNSWILEAITGRIYKNTAYSKLAIRHRYCINGYIDANYDNMYSRLDWVHWYDGRFVGSKLDYSGNFDQNKVESRFVYKGTEKVY